MGLFEQIYIYDLLKVLKSKLLLRLFFATFNCMMFKVIYICIDYSCK